MKPVLLVLLLFPIIVNAGDFFCQAGIGFRHEGPRIEGNSVSNPIGIAEFGYESDSNIITKWTHISGLEVRDAEYGLNFITIQKRWF